MGWGFGGWVEEGGIDGLGDEEDEGGGCGEVEVEGEEGVYDDQSVMLDGESSFLHSCEGFLRVASRGLLPRRNCSCRTVRTERACWAELTQRRIRERMPPRDVMRVGELRARRCCQKKKRRGRVASRTV